VNPRLLILLLVIVLAPALALTHIFLAKEVSSRDDERLSFTFGQSLFETEPLAEPTFTATSFDSEWPVFTTHVDIHDTGKSCSTDMDEFGSYAMVVHTDLRISHVLLHDCADWGSGHLTELAAPKPAIAPLPQTPLVEVFLPGFETPIPQEAKSAEAIIPMYDVWVMLLRNQPRPKRADEFLPHLKKIFAEEGVPEELAWIPEIESMFNPRAYNPCGARGLFQLMPITARAQGLRLRPYDERTNPEKSARAAAALLRQLHGMFDSWPLALAAYNAGEGRVRRTLKAGDATTFAEIADDLPIETRLYVPKVLATLAVREGVAPTSLPAPRYITQAGF
jgi:hypothetical protein